MSASKRSRIPVPVKPSPASNRSKIPVPTPSVELQYIAKDPFHEYEIILRVNKSNEYYYCTRIETLEVVTIEPQIKVTPLSILQRVQHSSLAAVTRVYRCHNLDYVVVKELPKNTLADFLTAFERSSRFIVPLVYILKQVFLAIRHLSQSGLNFIPGVEDIFLHEHSIVIGGWWRQKIRNPTFVIPDWAVTVLAKGLKDDQVNRLRKVYRFDQVDEVINFLDANWTKRPLFPLTALRVICEFSTSPPTDIFWMNKKEKNAPTVNKLREKMDNAWVHESGVVLV